MREVSQLVLPAADQYRQAAWRSDSALAAGNADSEVSGAMGGWSADNGADNGVDKGPDKGPDNGVDKGPDKGPDKGVDGACKDVCNKGRYADKRRRAVMAAVGWTPCS
jgi:hypothetical protein